MAGEEWYYAIDNVQKGPVSSTELKRLAQRGTLKPGHLVWKEGMSLWVLASRVKGLFSNSVSPPKKEAAPVRPAAATKSVSRPKPAIVAKPVQPVEEDAFDDFSSASAAESDSDDEIFESRPKAAKPKKKKKKKRERPRSTVPSGPEDDAGMFRRLGAFLIDLPIRVVISYVSCLLAFPIVFLLTLFQMGDRTIVLIISAIPPVIVFLGYDVFFEISRMQGTPGKYLLGIKVSDRCGNTISVFPSVLRTIMKLLLFIGLPVLVVFIPGMDKIIKGVVCPVIFFASAAAVKATDRKRGAYDLMADTYVLYR